MKKKNVVIGKLQLWIMLRQLLGGMEFSAARNKQDPEKNMEI